MKIRFPLVLSVFFLSALVSAEESAPNPEVLIVGRILIDRSDVFDLSIPEFNRIPYTWANAFHIVTREEFIRRDLLIQEGDLYDEKIIQESERLLRSRPIFRTVRISADPPVNGRVDLHVKTEDVWTTSIQVGYGTAGGKNFYRFGFLEHNFLGFGHSVGAFVRQDIDRFVKGATYKDPHLFGTRWEGFAGYGKDEKGQEWNFRAARDYDSVDTPYSAGAEVHVSNDEDRLFEQGEESEKFQHKRVDHHLFFSKAVFLTEHLTAHRVGVAFDDQNDEFSNIRLIQPEPVPTDHRVTSLMATYGYFQSQYEKKRGLKTFDREEDNNFGWDLAAGLGPEIPRWGAAKNGWAEKIHVGKAWRTGNEGVLESRVDFKGRSEENRLIDALTQIELEWYSPWAYAGSVFSLRGVGQFGKNLVPERQLLLGGENGLRGYSVRQFSGSKKIIFAAENRWDLIYDWLQLVNLGWAAFADAGGVWKENERIRFSDVKSDIGAGLRFAPSRSYDPSIIRADLAYALNNNDRRSRWVINIGGDLRFGDGDKKKYDQ